jgi:transcriptional regulator with PAS, ATPase and Fis domain
MLNKPLRTVDLDAMDCMLNYHWPGNVRELENAVEYAVNMASGDSLTLASLPPRIRESQEIEFTRSDAPLKDRVREFERSVFEEYLEHYGSSYEGKSDIAEKLEISRATLYRKLSELGLSRG